MEEIKVIFPESKSIKIGEDVVSVKEFKTGDLPKVVELVEAIFEEKGILDNPENKATMMKVVTQAVGKHADKVFELIALSTDLDIETIKSHRINVTIKLIETVFIVNLDFLTETVMPMVEEIVAGLDKKIKADGRIQSKSSYNMGTKKTK